MTLEECKVFIDDLRHALTVAGMNLEAWAILTNNESRALHMRTMNGYVHFFTTGINAHFVGMLMPFYRLYETTRGTLSIPRLLRQLRAEGTLPSSVLDELDTHCRDALPIWRKISILRNKAFGHRNATLTVSEVFGQAAVSENQFRELFAKTKDLLNLLTVALTGEYHAFNLGAGDSLKRMLEDLGRLRN